MGNVFVQAEEKALRDYYHARDLEEWWAELKRLGLPHPCQGCAEHCSPRCRFWDVRNYVGGGSQ